MTFDRSYPVGAGPIVHPPSAPAAQERQLVVGSLRFAGEGFFGCGTAARYRLHQSNLEVKIHSAIHPESTM